MYSQPHIERSPHTRLYSGTRGEEGPEREGFEEGPSLLSIINEVGGLFSAHFENGWFLVILERMSFNSIYLNDIRRLIELESVYPSDMYKVKTGISALEEFVQFSRRYVLPVLRDQLGISGFTRRYRMEADRNSVVIKELFAAAFPANLKRLEELSTELSRKIETSEQEEKTLKAAFYGSSFPVPSLYELRLPSG